MKIGEDSRQVFALTCNESDAKHDWHAAGFEKFTSIRVLGPIVQNNAGSDANYESMKAKVLKAYFANLHSDDGLTDIKLFQTATTGIIASWSVAQVLSAPVLKKLSKLQVDLSARLCPHKKPVNAAWSTWSNKRLE